MRFRQFLAEMPESEIPEFEHEISRAFSEIKITIKFSTHFEHRIQDENVDKHGHQRGSQITKAELSALFKKLKEKHEELIKKGQELKDFEGVIRDTLTELNVPFGLAFRKNLGRYVLTLVSAVKKKDFYVKPDDVVVDV